MKRLSILCVFLCINVATAADVYRFVDDQGNVIYTDRATPGAEKIETVTSPVPTTQPTPATPTPFARTPITESKPVESIPPQAKVKKFGGYTKFELALPQNDDSILDNNGNIALQIEMTPDLEKELGHQIAVYLNGNLARKFSSNSNIVLENIDRGTHEIEVSVIDGKGKTLKSSSRITVHLRRHSARFN